VLAAAGAFASPSFIDDVLAALSSFFMSVGAAEFVAFAGLTAFAAGAAGAFAAGAAGAFAAGVAGAVVVVVTFAGLAFALVVLAGAGVPHADNNAAVAATAVIVNNLTFILFILP
jgi:hypothetical protein